ncbi:MAG: hypothetical protein V1740_08455 [Candidatus Woesearchaeota archaeon]
MSEKRGRFKNYTLIFVILNLLFAIPFTNADYGLEYNEILGAENVDLGSFGKIIPNKFDEIRTKIEAIQYLGASGAEEDKIIKIRPSIITPGENITIQMTPNKRYGINEFIYIEDENGNEKEILLIPNCTDSLCKDPINISMVIPLDWIGIYFIRILDIEGEQKDSVEKPDNKKKKSQKAKKKKE